VADVRCKTKNVTVAVDIAFSVQADPVEVDSWPDLARACERWGFDTLLVADHLGSGSSPFVALAAAGAVTQRIQLGSYVANAGSWTPLHLAAEVATLDVVSQGRALLGVGAGHTPAEWTMTARPYPSGADRVARMTELVRVVRQLLAGETVSFRGDHVQVSAAVLEAPRPMQTRVPLLVGGNGASLLRFAAREADIVGLSGLGRTLADGHRHDVKWQQSAIDARVDLVRREADRAGRSPRLEALVQVVEITDDAEAAAHRLAERVPTATAEDVLGAPYALLGTVEEIASQVRQHQQRWGFTRFAVRAPHHEAARPVLARLTELHRG
jgi:probable F420-dependent oxidoreductase